MSTAHAADGAAIAYEVRADGPPLVLVHGITESRRAWDPLLDALAADHRVVALDLRGHGESERKPPYQVATMVGDVNTVVNDAGVSDPLLIGHSLGGAVVSFYAALYPVRGVIDIDQPIELSQFKEMLTPIEPMLRGDDAQFQAAITAIFDALSAPLPEVERARLRALAHPEQDVVLGVWDLVLTSNADELDALVSASAEAISAPYLALDGIDAGEDYERWLTMRVKQAVVETWAGHGHYPHLVDPSRFVERVRDFERSR
jgi:pimeloyl-ACP methyl ester carboxylesterase